MGVVDARSLYQILYAAATYSEATDPAAEINNYVVVNNLLTANVRTDSGQPDAWRDYQQILSELGLIFSTRVRRAITITPLGLAFLDGSLGFSEVITLQAFRYQYPNGHQLVIDQSLRQKLAGTPADRATTLAELQYLMGMMVRPGVLVWQILRGLGRAGLDPSIDVDEMQTYVMRCSTHADAPACTQAIASARGGAAALAPLGRARRNAQDWFRLLLKTPVFAGACGRGAVLRISPYGQAHAFELDDMCASLEDPVTFWAPTTLDPPDRATWYGHFGSVDVGVALIPETTATAGFDEGAEYQAGREHEQAAVEIGAVDRAIALRRYDPAHFGCIAHGDSGAGTTIDASYDAGLATRQHRLHDLMVLLIGNRCRARGAVVWDDPNTVDLLVQFAAHEFIVEVKSVTTRNFIHRIRYALGQLCHYAYMRHGQTAAPLRRVIAVPAQVPAHSWCIPFLNDHMDVDLLSLQGTALCVNTRSDTARALFQP